MSSKGVRDFGPFTGAAAAGTLKAISMTTNENNTIDQSADGTITTNKSPARDSLTSDETERLIKPESDEVPNNTNNANPLKQKENKKYWTVTSV